MSARPAQIGTTLRRLLAVLALLVAGWSVVGGTAFAVVRANEADIEDEVMCVQCGRPLVTSSGSAADQERALIQGWIEQGLTKAQIKQRLVAEYGDRALVNDQSPVAAAAPWIAAIVGVVSIALLLRRRRQRDDGPAADPTTAAADATNGAGAAARELQISAADEARIDAELAERG